MKYPYFIVQKRVGRLPCPPELRHTPIERQFKSGRLGGTKIEERICRTAREVRQLVSEGLSDGAEVLVYAVLRPDSPRLRVHNAHGRLWTVNGRQYVPSVLENPW